MRWRAAAALGALLLAAAAAIAAAAEAAAGVAAGRGGEGVGTGDDAATLDAVRLSEFERATLFTPEGLRRVHQVAATSAETGELADALPLYKLALVVAQRVHGGAHAATAAAASNLAGMHYTLGRHADAAEIYREAAKVYGRMGATERDVGYVTTLHNLALSKQAAGDLRGALPLYIDVVRHWERAVGKRHAAHATSVLNLAVAHLELGEHAEALKRATAALEVLETLGADVAPALGVVGAAKLAAGDAEGALDVFERRVSVRRVAANAERQDEHEEKHRLLQDLEDLARLRLHMHTTKGKGTGAAGARALDPAGEPGRKGPAEYARSERSFEEVLSAEVAEAARLRQVLPLRAEDGDVASVAWANVMAQLVSARAVHLRPAQMLPDASPGTHAAGTPSIASTSAASEVSASVARDEL